MSSFINELFSLTPEQFEEAVENLLRRVGMSLPEFEIQRLEKIKAPDGVYEIDVTARFEVLGASFLVLIECKLHRNPIKREVVQVLYDRLRAVGAHKGMIFSTAKFQRGAIEFARAHGIALIQLVDVREPHQQRVFHCLSNQTFLDSHLRRIRIKTSPDDGNITYKYVPDGEREK